MIRVDQSHLAITALTHPGMTGKNNEDRYAVSAFRLEARHNDPVLFAILADGIGGHRAGEVAAELAVNQVSQAVAASDGLHPVETLRAAIQHASQDIYTQAQGDPNRQGMGATCACAWIIRERLFTATVGDSRLYLVRNGGILRLSTDHTWIQEALDNGLLTPDQARNHPNAHVIRRYLGSPKPPDVDFRLRLQEGESDRQAFANQGYPLQEGDCLLLCSDGLTDLVEDDEILAAVLENPLETAGQNLVALANQRGGHDNITLVAIGVPAGAFRTASPLRSRMVLALAALITLAVLIAAALLGLDILNGALRVDATPASTSLPATQIVPVIPPPATTTALPGVTLTAVYPAPATPGTATPGSGSGPTASPAPNATPQGGATATPQGGATATPQGGAIATPGGPTITPWPTATGTP